MLASTVAEQQRLRQAFGAYPTGVTVVTTIDDNQNPVGFTANSFTSVSLDPPLLLVCPAKSMNLFTQFQQCAHFAVHVLAHDQRVVSEIFSSEPIDRFSQVAWHNDDWNCPVIEGAIACFSCETYSRVDAGDHIILIGRILDFHSRKAVGLGYSNNSYFNPTGIDI